MCAMAIRTLSTIDQTTDLTLRFEHSGTELTWGWRAKLKSFFELVQPVRLRQVTVTGIRADLDGRHPTNFLIHQRTNTVARCLRDAGVVCDAAVESESMQGFLGPRPGQVRLSLAYEEASR